VKNLGKTLRVNLTNREITKEEVSQDDLLNVIGMIMEFLNPRFILFYFSI
jgi:hypothetical protein